ncbi:MAG: acyltransferase [Candidatus Electrothrix sp. Rat3]|nr:acyltransferase [Candidatus Electrothrix rattekaaiensis]
MKQQIERIKLFLLLTSYYWFLRYLPEGYHHPKFSIFNTARSFIGRKLFLSCGRNVSIHRNAHFGTGRRLSVGSGSHLGVNCWINAKGSVTLGENVIMGPDVIILTGKHSFDNPGLSIKEQPMEYAPVVIEDDVWLGARVVVLPGCTIAKGSVIGANSVVSKDIPPYSVAVGSPISILRNRKIS